MIAVPCEIFPTSLWKQEQTFILTFMPVSTKPPPKQVLFSRSLQVLKDALAKGKPVWLAGVPSWWSQPKLVSFPRS